jgi:DNA polymerase-4
VTDTSAAGPVGVRLALPVVHLDLDCYFAAVEERAKPSLRGKPVVVGGLGGRGVVATANYPARELGVHSAMPTWQARRLAGGAAWLAPRGAAYTAHSREAFRWVRETFGRVEQLSFDEAYVDLTSGAADVVHLAAQDPRAVGELIRERVWAAVGLTCSVGVARHKLGAKLASEAAKPAGVCVLDADAEAALLPTLPVRALPGIGPVSAEKLAGMGLATVADLRARGREDVVRSLGDAHGRAMWALAHGQDHRPVEHERVRKSVGSERTFARDLGSPPAVAEQLGAVFDEAFARLQGSGHAARTVTVKVRYADFSTETRASSLVLPSEERSLLWEAAQRSLAATNVPGLGVRLLGVAFSALDEVVQLPLLLDAAPTGPGTREDAGPDAGAAPVDPAEAGPEDGVGAPVTEVSRVGSDVEHPELGRGWLLGARHGIASVRFETARTGPARTRGVPLDGRLRHVAPEPPLPAQPGEVPPWRIPGVRPAGGEKGTDHRIGPSCPVSSARPCPPGAPGGRRRGP